MAWRWVRPRADGRSMTMPLAESSLQAEFEAVVLWTGDPPHHADMDPAVLPWLQGDYLAGPDGGLFP